MYIIAVPYKTAHSSSIVTRNQELFNKYRGIIYSLPLLFHYFIISYFFISS